MPSRIRALSLLLIVFFVLLGVWWWYERDLSIYAEGFTEKGFQLVQPGMTEREVYELLGQPLLTEEVGLPEAWIYDEDEANKTNAFRKTYNLLEPPNRVEFDTRGCVVNASGNVALAVKAGMSKGQVVETIGRPREIVPSRFRLLHYSAPSGAGKYCARIIGIDELGHVTRITAYDIYD